MRRRWRWLVGVAGGLLLLVAFLAVTPFWLARWPAGLNRALDASGLARILGGTGGTQRVRIDRVVRFGPGGARLEGVRVGDPRTRGLGFLGPGRDDRCGVAAAVVPDAPGLPVAGDRRLRAV